MDVSLGERIADRSFDVDIYPNIFSVAIYCAHLALSYAMTCIRPFPSLFN